MSGGFNNSLGINNQKSFGYSPGTYQSGLQILTTPSSNNTKGAWLQIGSNTAYDTTSMMFNFYYYTGASGPDYASSIDVGYGPSGAQQVLLSNVNMCLAGATSANYISIFVNLLLPLQIPANNAIWFRYAVTSTSQGFGTVAAFSTFDSSFVGNRSITKYDTLNASANSTANTGRGTAIVSGLAAKGSYVQLGTTTKDYSGFFICCDNAGLGVAQYSGSPTIGTFVLVDIAIGTSGSQQIILPNYLFSSAGESCVNSPFYDIFIPAGTNIWARGSYAGNTATFGVTFYGAY